MKNSCNHISDYLKQTDNNQTNNTINNDNNNQKSQLNEDNIKNLENIYTTIALLKRLQNTKTDDCNNINDENSNQLLSTLKHPTCKECKLNSYRLHICVYCSYIGCFNDLNDHIREHAIKEKHYLAIDLIYAMVYCFICNDYKYDEKLEEISNKCFLKQKLFRFGKFTDWEPSQYHLNLLKTSSALSKTQTFKLKNSSIIGLRGLLNLGNTCFMNCILQTLTHTPMLRDYFLSDQHICCNNNNNNNNNNSTSSTNSNDGSGGGGSGSSYNNNSHLNKNTGRYCLVCEISSLFQEFYSGKRTPHIPFKLLHLVWTQVKHLAGYEQQDAHEFFIAALNAIHVNCIENDEEFNSKKKTNGVDYSYTNCNCIIDRIFTGGLQSDVVCSNCKNVSTKVDPYWDISLDLGRSNNTKSSQYTNAKEPVTLEDCLRRFTLPEILTSFNCSYCNCTNNATKQLTMKNLPIVGCFHLKRFEHSLKFHKKISTHISFPEILDMTPFMASRRNNNNTTNDSQNCSNLTDPNNQYFLFAVVNHHGTIESGHYTCFIRLTREQWFKCDDHLISKASLHEVMNSEGYLLFYHKIWLDYD